MTSPMEHMAASATFGDFVRLPHLFERREIKPVVWHSPNFRVEQAGSTPAGDPLFAVHVRRIEVVAPYATRSSRQHLRRCGDSADDARASYLDDPSLREPKAIHREQHLCLRCVHERVCAMANALDPDLLVTVSSCLGFSTEDSDDPCELVPVEPVAAQ
jgi:hypothetical protein